MIEILKPNDYKKIIEGLYELNDEMDIMQHLENYHAKYAEDNYHFSAILSQKISEVDDYDTTEDVQRYYYNKANNDPYCKIVLYIDAPNAVIRFAKVYIDYLAYCDDLVYPEENSHEENEISEEEILKFRSVLNKEQLLKVHKYLVDRKIIAPSSTEMFAGLFNDFGNELISIEKIKWQLSHQGKNFNRPLFSLFWFIDDKDESEAYQDEMKKFVRTIIANVEPVKEKNQFVPKSLEASFRRWKILYDNYNNGKKPALDETSMEIISFLKNVRN